MKITINQKEIELKYSIRSLIMFENITEKTFNPQGVGDVVTFFYCVVVSSAKDYSIEYDDFLDWLDENIDELKNFADWLQKISSVEENLKKN